MSSTSRKPAGGVPRGSVMNRLNMFEDKKANMGQLLQIQCKECNSMLCQGSQLFKIGSAAFNALSI
jgi:hypothetical protein